MDAFGSLYQRYEPLVRGYVRRRLPDHHLVEDITSDTFLRALTGIAAVHDQGRDVGAWLTTIARNLILDQVKSGRARRETLIGEPPEGPTDDPPEALLLTRMASAEVRAAVSALPEGMRACISYRFFADMSLADTATAMHRTSGAVRSLTYRAIRMLGRRLGPES